jgi:hypothetical protein
MDYDEDNVDDTVLVLPHQTIHDDLTEIRAWKGHDWDSLNRVNQKRLYRRPEEQGKIRGHDREGRERRTAFFPAFQQNSLICG